MEKTITPEYDWCPGWPVFTGSASIPPKPILIIPPMIFTGDGSTEEAKRVEQILMEMYGIDRLNPGHS